MFSKFFYDFFIKQRSFHKSLESDMIKIKKNMITVLAADFELCLYRSKTNVADAALFFNRSVACCLVKPSIGTLLISATLSPDKFRKINECTLESF